MSMKRLWYTLSETIALLHALCMGMSLICLLAVLVGVERAFAYIIAHDELGTLTTLAPEPVGLSHAGEAEAWQ